MSRRRSLSCSHRLPPPTTILYFSAFRTLSPILSFYCCKCSHRAVALLMLYLDCSRRSIYLLCLALENHREESTFQNHLTAKVLVVRYFPPSFAICRFCSTDLISRSAFTALVSFSSVHILQLLRSALSHSLLQAGCAFASKGKGSPLQTRICYHPSVF